MRRENVCWWVDGAWLSTLPRRARTSIQRMPCRALAVSARAVPDAHRRSSVSSERSIRQDSTTTGRLFQLQAGEVRYS